MRGVCDVASVQQLVFCQLTVEEMSTGGALTLSTNFGYVLIELQRLRFLLLSQGYHRRWRGCECHIVQFRYCSETVQSVETAWWSWLMRLCSRTRLPQKRRVAISLPYRLITCSGVPWRLRAGLHGLCIHSCSCRSLSAFLTRRGLTSFLSTIAFF